MKISNSSIASGLGCAVASLLLSSSIAFAATKAPTYYICSHKVSGAVAVRTKCKSTETKITPISVLTRATAYGFVNSDGTVATARSRNITSRKVNSGRYCIKAAGVDMTTVFPVATADFRQSTGVDHTVQLDTTGVSCNPDEWGIITKDGTTETDIAFSIMVP